MGKDGRLQSDPGANRTHDPRFRNRETAAGNGAAPATDSAKVGQNSSPAPQQRHNLSVVHRGVPLADRLWVRLSVDGECIVWEGALSSHGYGLIKDGGKPVRTHRAMWEMAKGPIPAGLEVDHLCRNRRCCRLDHLELVTHAENMRRAHEAKRAERALSEGGGGR